MKHKLKSFIITLKQQADGDMDAQLASFRTAVVKALQSKGLETHVPALPDDDLARTLGILSLDCTPEAARVIATLPQVEEMRREQTMHTQKPGQDRGYKPTPPTSFGTGKGPDKNCWDPRKHVPSTPSAPDKNCWDPRQRGQSGPADPRATQLHDWQVQLKAPNGDRSNEAVRRLFANFRQELAKLVTREKLEGQVDISGVGSMYAQGIFNMKATDKAMRKLETLDCVERIDSPPDFLDRRRPVARPQRRKAALPRP